MTIAISTAAQNQFIRSRILEIQRQMTVLQEQVSSGKRSSVFSGISEVSSLSLQLNNARKATNEFLDNISKARTRVQPVQTVLQRINDIAAEVRNDALVASSDALDATKGNGALKALAQQRLNEIVSLLNIRVDTDYLFAGRASSNPPMQSYGSVDQAGSILGQVAGLSATYPLGSTAASGEVRYNAIKEYLANSITRQAPGGTAPAPYGYSGETGAPGGNEFRFTVETDATAGDNSIFLEQGFDLPVPGQYIEFGGTPLHNSAYLVTDVDPVTREITFVGEPVDNGLEFDVDAGTAVNVTSPTVVWDVAAAGAAGSDTTLLGMTAGDTSITVSDITQFTVGDRIEFPGDAGTFYEVTSVDPATFEVGIRQLPNGGGVAFTAAAGEAIDIFQGYTKGTTSITLSSVSDVTAGMSVKFSNSSATYSVVSVNAATNTIEITAETTTSGQGLDSYIPPPVAVEGGTVTAQFGAPIDRLSVRIDNGIDLEYGIRGDNPAIRKVLDALFALATTDLNTSTQAGFREIARIAAEDLSVGRSMVADLSAELGVKENVLDTTETRHQDFMVVIETQLDRAENVDMAEAVTRLTQTQASLEASYKLLASLRNLSLSQYL